MWGTLPSSVQWLHDPDHAHHFATHARISLSEKASGWDTLTNASHVHLMNMHIHMDEDSQLALVQTIKQQVMNELRADGVFESPYFTPAEAAHYLRIKPPRINEMVCRGRLRGFKVGVRLLVLREDIYAMVTQKAWQLEEVA